MSAKAGFTLTECVVVLAIVMIVSGLSLPSISRTLDYATLTSAAEQVASIYEQARMRATQDNAYYTVLVSAPGQLCIDLDGDSQCGNTEPQAQLPTKISLGNAGLPVPVNDASLGLPLQTGTPGTYTQQGNLVSGLAWNARGLPCQRASTTSACSNLLAAGPPVTWIQYLQLRRGPNDVLFAAVTVNPSGRIRIWKYAPGPNGASWY